jgi:rhodanese-related sulfurtransferase
MRAGKRSGLIAKLCVIRHSSFVLAFMQFLANNWMLVLIMFMSGALLLFPLIQRRSSGMAEVGNQRLTYLINREDATVIDIREAREMTGTKLVGAVHIPFSQLKDRIGEIKADKAKPLIVYCSRGQRAIMAGSTLKAAGFTQLFNLNGGFKSWAEAGLPVEKL